MTPSQQSGDRALGRGIGAAVLVLATLTAIAVVPSRADDLEAATAARMGDYATAVSRWRTFAQQGDADSAYQLGHAYETGRGVPQDMHQAEQWYRTAAAAGSGAAAYALGVMAEETEAPNGLPQNTDAAIAWYYKAEAAGDPRAAERLAALGAGAMPEREPAEREPAQRAPKAAPAPAPVPVATRQPPRPEPPRPEARPEALPPDPAATFERAVATWRAHGIDAKDPSVLEALQTAAKQGYPLAQYDLAYAYQHGLGVSAEPARAYAWYRRAESSNGPARLREAAAANRRSLDNRLSDAEKQAASQIDEPQAR
ncbi:hypothetical protein GCM10011611_14170 [Aliidongia dinghuensis]|uniref:Sel1 repeat family protein n=1 Tax=Aliidongia dinghuensis TaxID=1867774 RepID=A0A8J2YSP3_9PROT|nr:tetratricopeptide repeat protein [Aliidongia dinghuensis]GGF09818.1 hypothetical protein GCM10011611_14170 [Aliidongia dinghuensis]